MTVYISQKHLNWNEPVLSVYDCNDNFIVYYFSPIQKLKEGEFYLKQAKKEQRITSPYLNSSSSAASSSDEEENESCVQVRSSNKVCDKIG